MKKRDKRRQKRTASAGEKKKKHEEKTPLDFKKKTHFFLVFFFRVQFRKRRGVRHALSKKKKNGTGALAHRLNSVADSAYRASFVLAFVCLFAFLFSFSSPVYDETPICVHTARSPGSPPIQEQAIL